MIPGEYYLVPCIERFDEDGNLVQLTPVIDHKHSDHENGQFYEHYHVDDRFLKRSYPYVRGVELQNGECYGYDIRPEVTDKTVLVPYMLKLQADKMQLITNVDAICKAKLTKFCISKGKCPHRGYDLSNEVVEDGFIRCPLHGLLFHAETGEMVDEHKQLFIEQNPI